MLIDIQEICQERETFLAEKCPKFRRIGESIYFLCTF